jgi:hypothetical protein
MMQKIPFEKEKVMQKRKMFISRAIILTFAGLVLSGIVLVDAAKAGQSTPLTVYLGLPPWVNFGQEFNISVSVQNNSDNPVIINKVAVGYGLEILRFRGPYEVTLNAPVTVPKKLNNVPGTASFNVPFKLATGAGTVVGMVVILAHDEYTAANFVNNIWFGVVGSGAGGVKVN